MSIFFDGEGKSPHRMKCCDCGKRFKAYFSDRAWASYQEERREERAAARREKRKPDYDYCGYQCPSCSAADEASEYASIAGAESGAGQEAVNDWRAEAAYGGW